MTSRVSGSTLPAIVAALIVLLAAGTIVAGQVGPSQELAGNRLATAGGDTDGDGVPDSLDNCPSIFNPGQLDVDGDTFGDACDNCVQDPNCDPGRIEIQRVLASDGADADSFGTVALSADGTTALVGARRHDGTLSREGAAYVYSLTDGTWTEVQKLTPSNPATQGYFGASVALSADGTAALIGAPQVGPGPPGSVYVFELEDRSWTEQQILTADDGVSGNSFGISVALDAHGRTALVGAMNDGPFGPESGSAYLFRRGANGWTQQQKLTGTGENGAERFGVAVSLSSDASSVLVGTYNVSGPGAAYVFVRQPGGWELQQRLTATDDHLFGYSVALSTDGNLALVGDPWDDETDGNAGAAYVLTRTGDVWTEAQKLTTTDPDALGRNFGWSVALSPDTTTALVGARGDNDNGGESGAAYLLTSSGGVWTEQQKLTASDGAGGDEFGHTVALSSDGRLALVGAQYDDDQADDAGSAYFFSTACQQDLDEDGFGDACDCQPTDTSSFPGAGESCDGIDNDCDRELDEGFGGDACEGVGVCGAGVTECDGAGGLRCDTDPGGTQDQSSPEICDGLDNDCDGEIDDPDVIDPPTWYEDIDGDGFGAPYSAVVACLPPAGFVAGIDNCPAVANPSQSDLDGDQLGDACDNCPAIVNCDPAPDETQTLFASDAEGGDRFGRSVTLARDGKTALIGIHDLQGSNNFGSAYVYTLDGGAWSEQQQLTPSDTENLDHFGFSGALSADGTTALIGAYGNDGDGVDLGAAYVFTLEGGVWTEQAKLNGSGNGSLDAFGYSVSLSSDGTVALVGDPFRDSLPLGEDSGAAHIFVLDDGLWTEQQKLTASDTTDFDRYGISVALSADGQTALIGANTDDDAGANSGSVYVFTHNDGVWTEQQKLAPNDAMADDGFGSAIALSADGTTAIIGAPGISVLAERAVAFVFRLDDGVWTERRKLTSEPEVNQTFGVAVALSSEGATALVGASIDGASDGGAAYLFSGGNWSETRILTPSDVEFADHFGISVALSGDGNSILVGAEDFFSDGTGYAVAFLRDCQLDEDQDGSGDICDCGFDDPSLWDTPGEALSLSLGADPASLSWSAPVAPGGQPGTTVYDTIRSTDPTNFMTAATCVESDDGLDQSAVDNAEPAPGVVWTYLVRAENACGEGLLGAATDGPRPPALSCPD